MDLDPAHLRSFLAIVRYGGYHRAADALHLTQPAVSRHIRRLEEQLGEPLFARRGRGVELTPYGERAAAELGDVLAAHDGAVARLQRGGADAGPFVLGVIENLVDPVLPDLLAVVREQHGRRGRCSCASTARCELVERVARGEVDAAIVVDAGDAPERVRARRDPAALVGEPGARRGGRCPSRSRSWPTTRRAGCAISRCAGSTSSASTPSITAESPHLSGVHAAVRNGLGYALLAAGGDGLRAVAPRAARRRRSTPGCGCCSRPGSARSPRRCAPRCAARWQPTGCAQAAA